ncbi:MAG: hypothetical protein CL694_10250 [Chloroflexi bacterium]|jgi:hypothetical protein|nr:hypothetical protein [Chloroflexota bacterium]MDP6799963.1 amidohydrolase [SAR202 cluster bacterium]MQG58761.1 amidohydrolase [SAR202 cluster bacterium]|tara:strand:+ start:7210 stop:8760 length:1551 start_codon:yes stop_codon:yes gene_type:complete
MNRLYPDLLLRGCRVLTMNPARPFVESVAVKGNRIVWIGTDAEAAQFAVGRARTLDCGGGTVLPGFHDAHCHLFAYAASLRAVDCRPGTVSSISEVRDAISRRASETQRGDWIRATGYSDFDLRERRHPTRLDLDAAAPDHPVRLDHRSGHACVLNSRALDAIGLTSGTPEPPEGTIDRFLESGEPNGVLLEMHEHLDGLIPRPSDSELRDAVRHASAVLASKGITTIQDATAGNSIDRWNAFRSMKSDGSLHQRATFMPGFTNVGSFARAGLHYGQGGHGLTVGAAKVMVTASAGRLRPDAQALMGMVLDAHRQGFQVAIHAVEAEAVAATAAAIAAANQVAGSVNLRHRIEHCSEMPPDVFADVVASGAVCVLQPGFIFESGERYIAQTEPMMLPWLYRGASLADAGVHVAFGSDAPVAAPDPLLGVYAAVTRLSDKGSEVGVGEATTVGDALRFSTATPAYAARQETDLGVIAPGMLADMVLLDRNPLEVDPSDIAGIKPMGTITDGRVVWQK